MQDSSPSIHHSRVPNTWRSLLVLTGFVLLGMSIGNMLAVLLLLGLLGGEQGGMDLVTTLIQSPQDVPNGWNALMLLQATAHVSAYLIPPLLYWYYIERRRWSDFQTTDRVPAAVWGTVALLVVAFMPFNGLLIEWNSNMVLPDALGGVEEWMRGKEDQLAELTAYLTGFERVDQLLLALLVVAVIPAVGEEVLFRGVLQRKLARHWRNPHAAIWVAAVLFSAIHVQFYGFIPRLMLGALFGYLYYWTGSLPVAIFAHFVNNAFMVVMLFLYHRRAVAFNIEDSEAAPAGAAVASLLVSAALLYGLRLRADRRRSGGTADEIRAIRETNLNA